MLAGFSVYGYFIYAFLVPAAMLHAIWTWQNHPPMRPRLKLWIAGVILGVSPYALGYLSMVNALGGISNFTQYLSQSIQGLDILRPNESLDGRFELFFHYGHATITSVGPTSMMFQRTMAGWMPHLKLGLLLGLPLLGLIGTKYQKISTTALPVIAGFVLGFLILVITFGTRIWLHHFTALLPLLYGAVAITLEQGSQSIAKSHCSPKLAFTLLLPLMMMNGIDTQNILRNLRATGGIGLYSDALSQFAEDSLTVSTPTHAFFPDWGIYMPFALITGGTIPYSTDFSSAAAHSTLCHHEDVLLALVSDHAPERILTWSDEMSVGQPTITTYRQRDGKPVLTAARWEAAHLPATSCP